MNKARIFFSESKEYAMLHGHLDDIVRGEMDLPAVNHIDTFDETLDVLEQLLNLRDQQSQYKNYINSTILRYLSENLNGFNSFTEGRAYVLWQRLSLDEKDYTPDIYQEPIWKNISLLLKGDITEDTCDREIQDMILVHHWNSPKWEKRIQQWCEYSTQMSEIDWLARIGQRIDSKNTALSSLWIHTLGNIASSWPLAEDDISILPVRERFVWSLFENSFFSVKDWRTILHNDTEAKKIVLSTWSVLVRKRRSMSNEEMVKDNHEDVMLALLEPEQEVLWDLIQHKSYSADIGFMESIIRTHGHVQGLDMGSETFDQLLSK